jgi:hypothetical protein
MTQERDLRGERDSIAAKLVEDRGACRLTLLPVPAKELELALFSSQSQLRGRDHNGHSPG